MNPPITELLADLMRRGITIEAAGDKLRYRPRERMTPSLADRLKRHKVGMIAALNPTSASGAEHRKNTDVECHAIAAKQRINSESAQVPNAPEEQRINRGIDAIMAVFPSTLVKVEQYGMQPDGRRYVCQNPRRQAVVDLILPIHRRDPDRATALRDAWMERIAICEIDGGLPADAAEAIALNELRASLEHAQAVE